MKPLLLIDVDGVLNPLGYFYKKAPPQFTKHKLLGYAVHLNPEHGEWLNGLANSFELVWATTWEEDANKLIAPILGLPQLPVIHFDKNSTASTWKLPAVKEYVGDRDFAWIDDDLWDDAKIWAQNRESKTLLIDINGITGLEDKHIQLLEEFSNE